MNGAHDKGRGMDAEPGGARVGAEAQVTAGACREERAGEGRGAASPGGARGGAGPEGLASWLDQFGPMLRLPRRVTADIRDELGAHLCERAHDLMIAGLPEARAVNAAIAELGDAASLATSLGAIERAHRRRRLMTGSALAVSGLALALGVGAFVHSGPRVDEPPSNVRVYTPSHAWWVNEPSAEAQAAASRTINLEGELTVAELLSAVSKATGLNLDAHWQELEMSGMGGDDAYSMNLKGATLAQVFRAFNDRAQVYGGGGLDYRINGNTLEIAPREYFDRHETALAVYDIQAVLNHADGDEVRELLSSLVEPDSWVDNGGDTARMYIVAGKLFITAPPRMHEKAAWVLEQLADDDDKGAGAINRPAPGQGDTQSTQAISLKHTDATEVARIVDKVSERLEDSIGDVTIVADARTNSLIVQARQGAMDAITLLVSELDIEW